MKVIIIEPNSHHYEIVPGFARYFLELQCDVTVLTEEHSGLGNEFALYEKNIRIKHFKKNKWFDALLSEIECHKYDLVFVTSFDYYVGGCFYNIIDKLNTINIPYVGCYHDLGLICRQGNEELVEQKRVVSLSEYTLNNQRIPVINPHYFGNVGRVHEKSNRLRIVSVGVSNNRYEIENAVDSLNADIDCYFIGRFDIEKYKIRRKKCLIAYPISRFLRIKKYSSEKYKPVKKSTLNRIFNYTNLSFEEMFGVILKSDFIILNLDDNIRELFTSVKTSGAKQLSLGFTRPCIISRKIASAYGFSEKNAVIYDSDIKEGIRRASNMSKEEYIAMCDNLLRLAEEIEKKSLNTLKEILETFIK